jgi:hypothetical protein
VQFIPARVCRVWLKFIWNARAVTGVRAKLPAWWHTLHEAIEFADDDV